MDYKEAIDYLFSRLPMFSRTGAAAYKPGLETAINLARHFGDPHTHFKSIHIAGTNGKGSTSHMIASILQEEGYKVALYTSPHLKDFRERIRINGRMIPESKVIEFVEAWKRSNFEGSPSFFELTMMMAFKWFADEKVDFAVIEVGMGGRLDSTNIISPLLSVITNISYDHNQFLGDTLEKIAGEKAGIIKAGVPVVIGESQPETQDVFISKAKDVGAPITFADKQSSPIEIHPSPHGWKCEAPNLNFQLPLGGDYQKKNLVTVLEAIRKLRDTGIVISDEAISRGMEKVVSNTGLAGRWMIIDTHPLIIADTGHNIAGLSYNFRQLNSLISQKTDGKLRVIIGFVADKAIDKILDILPKDAEYYITNAQIPRALAATDLYNKFKQHGIEGRVYVDVASAFLQAKKEASEKDIIFIGGSTFIVADFLLYLDSCGVSDS